ncbi:MAG: HAD family hydrolase [Calditrichia bacterium]
MFNIRKYSTILFDLDDTIYSEIEYLKHAFGQIARDISTKEPALKSNDIEKFLVSTFLTEGRQNLYQKMLNHFAIAPDYKLEDFLKGLRHVVIAEDSIPVFPFIEIFINHYHDQFSFFIVTNGNKDQQENKFRSIALPYKHRFKIIYCNLFGEKRKKPSAYFINYLEEQYGISREKTLFIGDGDVDKVAAINGGIDFLYVKDFEKYVHYFVDLLK